MTKNAAQQILTQAMPADTVQLKLGFPIKRGDQVIDTITIRKPGTGELRGINMQDVIDLNTDTLNRLKSRITIPAIVEDLDISDLVSFGALVLSFLGKPKAQIEIQEQLRKEMSEES